MEMLKHIWFYEKMSNVVVFVFSIVIHVYPTHKRGIHISFYSNSYDPDVYFLASNVCHGISVQKP